MNPDKTPKEDMTLSFGQKMYRSRHLIPCVLLIVFIVWVMVIGWATATESAAYGVLGSLAIAWWSGGLTRETFWQSLMGATRLSCMIMFILAGAAFLSSCMAFTGIPKALAEWVASIQPTATCSSQCSRDLHSARHRARRRLDDRAHDVDRDPDGREGRVRPRVVRHLHRAAGRDRRGDASARLQPVRAADDERRGSNYVAYASIPFFFMMFSASR
jgi:hypothetical protein